METVELHKQKIQILGRLIKESSLTLEEALLLLKEKEEQEEKPAAPQWINTHLQTTSTQLWPNGTGVLSTNTVPQYNTYLNTHPNITATNTTSSVLMELEKAIDNANI